LANIIESHTGQRTRYSLAWLAAVAAGGRDFAGDSAGGRPGAGLATTGLGSSPDFGGLPVFGGTGNGATGVTALGVFPLGLSPLGLSNCNQSSSSLAVTETPGAKKFWLHCGHFTRHPANWSVIETDRLQCGH
jgi:hypothetical protein